MLYLPEVASRAVPCWSVIGPAALVNAVTPLVDEWRRRAAVIHVHRLAPCEPLAETLGQLLGARPLAMGNVRCDRPLLLVLEDPTLPSLRTQVAGTALSHSLAPLPGWLRMGACALAAYAARAVEILRRVGEVPASLVLLGPREERYRAALDEVQACAAGASTLCPLRWSAERIRKSPLLNALQLGAAAALYLGHGNRHGWLAYGGLGSDDFVARAKPWSPDESTAVFFALGCGGASPSGIADVLVGQGVAGAVLAPIGDPLHIDNRQLALALVNAMAHGHLSLAHLLEAVSTAAAAMHGGGYMVIGDPGLAARAAPGALARGLGVFAPAPDAVLVPVDAH